MSQVSVPITVSTFLGLADFLKTRGSSRDPVSVIEDAIDYWMDNASWKQEDLMPETMAVSQYASYPWRVKSISGNALPPLSLPHGTKLRIRIGDLFRYAEVKDGAIIYDGSVVRSANEFALQVAGHARDAWRDVCIRRPTDQDYKLAEELRDEIRSKFS